MSFDLDGRVAIVTGGGRGIGQQIAKLFARHRARVVVATRTRSFGETTVKEIEAAGGCAHLISTDIGEKKNCFDVVAETVAVFGDLDIIVHNAAAAPYAPIAVLSDENLSATMNTNLMAAIWLTQAAWPHLTDKRAKGGGRLVLVTSLAGMRTGEPGMSHYGASKAGLYGFALGAAAELAPFGATANVVEPGVTRSDMFSAIFPTEASVAAVGAEHPLGRVVEGEDVAAACLYFALPQSSALTGQFLTVDCGMTTCDLGARIIGMARNYGTLPSA
jgi:3-oxoacyl-[acyl-carrier protein] reductase